MPQLGRTVLSHWKEMKKKTSIENTWEMVPIAQFTVLLGGITMRSFFFLTKSVPVPHPAVTN